METMNLIEKKGLAVLRLGLGGFLLLWGIDKLVSPESTVKIFQIFYSVPIDVTAAYIIGAVEIVIALVIMAGMLKKYSYGLGLLLHGVSTLSTYKELAAPFGKNHLFIAALPVLAGFVALYLLRHQDTVWCWKQKG